MSRGESGVYPLNEEQRIYSCRIYSSFVLLYLLGKKKRSLHFEAKFLQLVPLKTRNRKDYIFIGKRSLYLGTRACYEYVYEFVSAIPEFLFLKHLFCIPGTCYVRILKHLLGGRFPLYQNPREIYLRSPTLTAPAPVTHTIVHPHAMVSHRPYSQFLAYPMTFKPSPVSIWCLPSMWISSPVSRWDLTSSFLNNECPSAVRTYVLTFPGVILGGWRLQR